MTHARFLLHSTINPPRPGKKLLVLDLDYTLLDFKGTESSMERLKRPFCDEMLEVRCPSSFFSAGWRSSPFLAAMLTCMAATGDLRALRHRHLVAGFSSSLSFSAASAAISADSGAISGSIADTSGWTLRPRGAGWS